MEGTFVSWPGEVPPQFIGSDELAGRTLRSHRAEERLRAKGSRATKGKQGHNSNPPKPVVLGCLFKL